MRASRKLPFWAEFGESVAIVKPKSELLLDQATRKSAGTADPPTGKSPDSKLAGIDMLLIGSKDTDGTVGRAPPPISSADPNPHTSSMVEE